MPAPYRPAADRFWEKVVITPGCWLWTGARGGGGYGIFTVKKPNMIGAHRWAWQERNGPVPEGLVLNHRCRERTCVNPAHLEAVTQRENVHYSDRALGVRTARTHCPQGHERTPENQWVDRNGYRLCKPCSQAREKTRPPRLWLSQERRYARTDEAPRQ